MPTRKTMNNHEQKKLIKGIRNTAVKWEENTNQLSVIFFQFI